MSEFEKVIYSILKRAGVDFVQEKQFKDLRKGLYRFDFYIPTEQIAIEANGMQHYQYTKIFHKKRDDFLKAQERDRQKISYCLANNIRLFIIPYWEKDNLHTYKDLLNGRYRAHNKFHNDLIWRQQKFLNQK